MTLVSLGGLELRDAAGPLVALSPKRLALLVYLAVARPRGQHQRDALLALFYPESDTTHARSAFRHLLHDVRLAIGDDALTSCPRETVAVNHDLVRCDVWEFEEAVTSGDFENALALCTGPFLAGFHLNGCPDFEQWAEAERRRLHRAVVGSLEQLALSSMQRGDSRGSAGWWQQLLAHEPHATYVTLGLMEALADAGDRAAALQAAEGHAARLRRDFDAEPSRDVEAFADRLKAQPPGRAHRRPAVVERLSAAVTGRYTIEELIGVGGMALVYRAVDVKHKRSVALKVLRPELAAALGSERFLQEIEIAARLNHPNILPLHDSGAGDDLLYYVMPFIEGESLRERLTREGPLPIAESLHLAGEVVDALGYAHAEGVVHRDIKPENILISSGHALVADFGVARAACEAGGRLTEMGSAVGTPAYLSPEQASGEPEFDGRSDVYALGCVLYEMLVGEPPFIATTPENVVRQHLAATPKSVTEVRPTVPADVAAIASKALAKAPADRYQTAEALGEAIEAAQVGLLSPVGEITPARTMSAKQVVKRRWMTLGAPVAVTAIVVVLVALASLPHESGVILNPNHVAVAAFRNATGDQSLDQLGERVGHWITRGIQQAAFQVTPWDGALQAWRYVQSEADSGRVSQSVRAFAEETGAGIVVSGAVYLENDSLEVHANVTEVVRGRPAGTIDPIRGSRESVRQVIADVQQSVMGFFAVTSDERFAAQATDVVQPPSYEAYRAFDDGMAHYYRHEWREALPHFYRAIELDSTFVAAFVYAILQHVNRLEWARADSLIGILGHQRDRLSEYDLNWLDYLAAYVDGDSEGALLAIRRAAELAPGSRAWFNRAHAAMWLNRPQEAIDALSTLDPERGQMRGWRVYFNILIHSYLHLGKLQEALQAAQKQRAIYGDNRFTLYFEALAQAANGRIEEVNALVDELAALPEPNLGHILTRVAVRLRLLGRQQPAHSTVNRAIRWFEAALPGEKLSAEWRERYSWALYVAERCDEAYDIARPLSDEFPEFVMYQGLLGVVAACRGNEEEALAISERLQRLDRPYLRGLNTAWLSLITGALGDGENAVALWRQAVAQGVVAVPTSSTPPYQIWFAFETIHAGQLPDYAPFLELIEPKG